MYVGDYLGCVQVEKSDENVKGCRDLNVKTVWEQDLDYTCSTSLYTLHMLDPRNPRCQCRTVIDCIQSKPITANLICIIHTYCSYSNNIHLECHIVQNAMCMYSGISLARTPKETHKMPIHCIFIAAVICLCKAKVYFVVQKGLLLLVGYFCLNCSLNRTQLNSKEHTPRGGNRNK